MPVYWGAKSQMLQQLLGFFGENHDLDILLQRNGETLLSVHLTMEKAPAYPACRHMLGKKRGPGGMLALEMKR